VLLAGYHVEGTLARELLKDPKEVRFAQPVWFASSGEGSAQLGKGVYVIISWERGFMLSL
jgi:hypothetical protein